MVEMEECQTVKIYALGLTFLVRDLLEIRFEMPKGVPNLLYSKDQ